MLWVERWAKMRNGQDMRVDEQGTVVESHFLSFQSVSVFHDALAFPSDPRWISLSVNLQQSRWMVSVETVVYPSESLCVCVRPDSNITLGNVNQFISGFVSPLSFAFPHWLNGKSRKSEMSDSVGTASGGNQSLYVTSRMAGQVEQTQ